MNLPARPTDSYAAPRPSSAEIRRLFAAELSLPARLGFTGLLLAGLAAASVTAALLVTEPALPPRTRVAFGLMTAIGLAWAAFAAWVLGRRRVLLAGHRVVAARMAVACTALFTLGTAVLGILAAPGGPWLAAGALGAGMLALAILQLARARRRFDALSRRRLELEREVGGAGVPS